MHSTVLQSCSLVGCVKLVNKTSVLPSAPQASAGTPDSRHASSRWLVCQRPRRARHTLLTGFPSRVIPVSRHCRLCAAPAAGSTHPTHRIPVTRHRAGWCAAPAAGSTHPTHRIPVTRHRAGWCAKPAAGSTHPTHRIPVTRHRAGWCASTRGGLDTPYSPDSRHASSRWLVCQRPRRARHTLLTRFPSRVIASVGCASAAAGSTHPTHQIPVTRHRAGWCASAAAGSAHPTHYSPVSLCLSAHPAAPSILWTSPVGLISRRAAQGSSGPPEPADRRTAWKQRLDAW